MSVIGGSSGDEGGETGDREEWRDAVGLSHASNPQSSSSFAGASASGGISVSAGGKKGVGMKGSMATGELYR